MNKGVYFFDRKVLYLGAELDIKEKEGLEGKLRKAESKVSEKPVSGGLYFDRSPCCNAPVVYSKGGIITPICSKCKMEYKSLLIRS